MAVKNHFHQPDLEVLYIKNSSSDLFTFDYSKSLQFGIFVLFEGSARVTSTSGIRVLNESSLILSHKNEKIKIETLEGKPVHFLSIQFLSNLFSQIDNSFDYLLPFTQREVSQIYSFDEFTDKGCQNACEMIIKALKRYVGRPFIFSSVMQLISEINYGFINRDQGLPLKQTDSIFAQIIDYIDKYLFDTITLESISKQFFISQSYVTKLFRKISNTSFNNYLTQKRLEVARSLFEKNYSLKTVASLCGYSAYSSFFRAYKKVYGCSPSQDLQSFKNRQ